MTDLCTGGGDISEISLLAHNGVVDTRTTFDYLGLQSSMDDIYPHLLKLRTYISRRFIGSIENLVHQDIDSCSRQFQVCSYGQHRGSTRHFIFHPVFEGCSSSSMSYGAETSLQGREPANITVESPVKTRSEVTVTNKDYWVVSSILQRLMLPLFGFRLAWKVGLVSWRFSFRYIRNAQACVRRITSRVQKTLHGSSDEIGWLQRTPGMAPVQDGTARFLELLESIRNEEHKLPNTYVYLLIPGLFSNHGPLYFVSVKRFLSRMGLACHIAKIHSEVSVEHNAWELKQYIEELYWGSGKQVMLLGHSKGGVDAAAALSIYWSDLENKVAGLALVQSPYGGTPVASDILREGQIADRETRRVMEFLICKLIKGDIRALEDLTYKKRREFIMNHKLPDDIPIISFHSEANLTPGVLATMSHIAHAELPRLPLPRFGGEESDGVVQTTYQFPVAVPLSAAMAVCALHLQLRYGEKSDGLVTCCDAEVPGAVVVRPDRKLDHAWMVYSSSKNERNEPDSCHMWAAILTMLVELGKMKGESS